MSLPEELWVSAPGWEGWYEVSDRGQVRRIRKPAGGETCRLMARCPGTWGYLLVHLRADGRNKTVAVHRLVAVAFLGDPPDGHEVNHKDGDKANCGADNLEYVTHGDNMRHAFATGLNDGRGLKERWTNTRHIPNRGEGGRFLAGPGLP